MEGFKKCLQLKYISEIIAWIIIILLIIFKPIAPIKNFTSDTLVALIGIVLAFCLLYYYISYKIVTITKRSWLKDLKNTFDVILVGALIYLARDIGIFFIALIFLPIAASIFLLGSINSLLIAIAAIVLLGFELVLKQTESEIISTDTISTLWPIIGLIFTVIFTRALAHKLYEERKLRFETENKLKEVKKRAEDFESLSKEFISLTAHQLYTPLSVIRGFSSTILESKSKLDKKFKHYVDNIHQYSLRMINLVKELLNVAHIESGKFELQLKPTNFKKLLETITAEMSSKAAIKKNNFIFHYPKDDIPKVNVDMEKTQEILTNIISNAIKYSYEKSVIEITLRLINQKNNQFVQIDITNHGVGIPKDEQKFVFQRFFRASNILSVNNHGTGLGLYIAKKLVELHGGTLSFQSVENETTTFSIILPIVNP